MNTVDVGGLSLAYERAGSGAPVLLLGGTGMPPAAWSMSGMVNSLVGAGCEVVTYAARGVAPSSAPPGPYTVQQLAADAAGLIERLELDDVAVVGYSLGSFTAEVLAADHPERLRAAVLLAGAGPVTGVLRTAVNMEQELIRDLGRIPAAAATFQTLMTSLPPATLATDGAVVADWIELLALQGDAWTSIEGEIGQAAAAAAWIDDTHRQERLARVSTPVLVMAFEYDPMFPPATCRQTLDLLPDAEFAEVPGAAHAGVLTHPMATADVLIEFLSRA